MSIEIKKPEKVLTKYYKNSLDELSLSIKRECEVSDNEATVVSTFEISLFNFIYNEFGLKYFPKKERLVNTERHINKGRIDSKYGAFIIEFKHYSKLSTIKLRDKATKQILEYLGGLNKSEPLDYLGLITDGVVCRFVRVEDGLLQKESWIKISEKVLDRIIKSILLLEQIALNSKNLIKDFCEPLDNSIIKKLAISLFNSININPTEKTNMLFEEWKSLFRLAHNDATKQLAIQERRKSLSDSLSVRIDNNETEYKALYSLQTCYAIIIKLIAYKVISKIRFSKSLIDFNSLSAAGQEVIRLQLENLEDGAIFRSLGITNLLEGDFFSWYSTKEQWSENVFKVISEIFEILTKYEDKVLSEIKGDTRDLFKELYEYVIPAKVRHSLGEYYTPGWLADSIVSESLSQINNKNTWTALDPCAGSGTFITVLISKIIINTKELNKKKILFDILKRVRAIDLNPLAVLTCRINYFVNIANLISNDDVFEIPVYLGDSSYVPEKIKIGRVECFQYVIRTLKGNIFIVLPISCLNNPVIFSKTMTDIEHYIKTQNRNAIHDSLTALIPSSDLTDEVKANISNLSEKFIELEKNNWNGIWARIVTNFLTTANLGKFDLIVGNLPWVDWKSLPEGYREKIKSLCIERHLFSGDRLTGGINLNICALISNVSAGRWLKKDGVMGFLMPESLIFQQTYEGFRNFQVWGTSRLYFNKFHNWTKAGHPFKPVQQKFLSYFISAKKIDYKHGVPVVVFVKEKGKTIESINKIPSFEIAKSNFKSLKILAGQCNSNTAFTYAKNSLMLKEFSLISGDSFYIGREGIEFYPQELFLFKIAKDMPIFDDKIYLDNFQNEKSKYKIPKQTILLEKEFLHPLIKGVNIEKNHILIDSKESFLVPFPYSKEDTRLPIKLELLSQKAPLLARFLINFKHIFESQTDYNTKIIGKKDQDFYALARVGSYSFADSFVVFRDNTKWQASVVSGIDTNWGGQKRPLFQNHAVSISEDKNSNVIKIDEAYFICAILNAPITKRYIESSSDSRTFKIRPNVYIPKYNRTDKLHLELSRLSKIAHENWDNKVEIKDIDKKIEDLYVSLCKRDKNNKG